MMTGRGRWMTLPAMIGLFLGVLQRTPELSLLSLSVLLWLAAEWTLFCWRVRVELPRLQIERTVNGLSEPTGRLWAGRTATIVVKVTLKPGRFGNDQPERASVRFEPSRTGASALRLIELTVHRDSWGLMFEECGHAEFQSGCVGNTNPERREQHVRGSVLSSNGFAGVLGGRCVGVSRRRDGSVGRTSA